MTDISASKTKGSLPAKKFLIISGSFLIYLSMLVAFIAAVVAVFSKIGTGESIVIISTRAFFNALYVPTILVLMISMVAILLFSIAKLAGAVGTDSAKMSILLFAIFVFAVGGSVGPLLDFRPDPTIVYLIIFAVLAVISLIVHIYLLLFRSTASLIEKGKRSLLVFPYVIMSVFSAMSLVQAMMLYINPNTKAEGILKLCTGILSPIWAIACLFIPTVILYWLDDRKPTQEIIEKEQTKSVS